MADETVPREDELADRQDAALYPVGRALRRTFDAENHDSLGTDLTGLMLELARVDPEAPALPRGSLPLIATPAAVTPLAAHPAPPSWWRAVMGRLLAR